MSTVLGAEMFVPFCRIVSICGFLVSGRLIGWKLRIVPKINAGKPKTQHVLQSPNTLYGFVWPCAAVLI